MKSLKNQSIIIFLLTIISVFFLYNKFDDSKILYEGEIDIMIDNTNTYYGSNRNLYTQTISKYVQKNTTFIYENFSKYWIVAPKREIIEESTKLVKFLHTVNEENYLLSKKIIKDQKNYIESIIFKGEIFMIPHQPYNHDQLFKNYKNSLLEMTDDIREYIKKNEKILDDTFLYNKELLNNFSIDDHFLFRKSKTKLEIINLAIIFGILAEFFCIILHKRKLRKDS